jgi:chromosome segregation ATPase
MGVLFRQHYFLSIRKSPVSPRMVIPFVTMLSVTTVSGLLATGAAFLAVKSLRSRATRELNKDSTSINSVISQYDDAINNAIGIFDGMVSLDEIIALQSGRAQLLSELEIEKSKLSAKEKQLERAQTDVDKQEQRHSELKRGKEGCDEIVRELQENKGIVESETHRMLTEVSSVKDSLEQYAVEYEDSLREHRGQFDNMLQTLSHMSDQLSELSENHELAAQRFIGLQKQYSELEREYRRLVDREISGDFNKG